MIRNSIKKLIDKRFDTKVDFGLQGVYKGHHNITYKGIPCVKCPFDYVMYQMIINEIKPDLIIEIGTNQGGSALYMADLLDSNGKGEIHTIDINDRSKNDSKKHPRIKFFHDGWESYDLRLAENFNKILVIEDSSHEYKNTLLVINKFFSLVTPGSYLIVEDGIVDELGLSKSLNGGPVKAIKEFLSGNSQFVIDTRWTNMFGNNTTFNTIGYLKRKE